MTRIGGVTRVCCGFECGLNTAVGTRLARRSRRLNGATHCLLLALVWALAAGGGHAARAAGAFVRVPPTVHPRALDVADAAARFHIPEQWIWAVMRAESSGDTRALSSAGAMGLMQVMPSTWAMLRDRYALGSDPYDPRDNILAGAAYLRELHDRYGPLGMLAAYNAGPGRYEQYAAQRRRLPEETERYIAHLLPLLDQSSPPSAPPRRDTVAINWHRSALFPTRLNAPAAATETPANFERGVHADTGVSRRAVDPLTLRSGSALFVPRSGVPQ